MQGPPDNISKVDLIIGQDGVFYVLSDHFFNKDIGWLEYYAAAKRLEFIMDDGDIRNFSVPVDPAIAVRLEDQTAAFLIKGTLDNIQEHGGYALIVHR